MKKNLVKMKEVPQTEFHDFFHDFLVCKIWFVCNYQNLMYKTVMKIIKVETLPIDVVCHATLQDPFGFG